MKTNQVNTEQEGLSHANEFTDDQRKNGFLLSIAPEGNKELFWKIQRILTLPDRIKAYPLLFLVATYNKIINGEVEFIKRELEKYYGFLDLPETDLSRNGLAHHNALSYIKFLEAQYLKLEEKELEQKLSKYNKIPSVLSRTELTAFLLFFFKDSGILAKEITDYHFSKWIEKTFLFQDMQEMKFIKQEMSKFRRLEYDITKFEEYFLEFLKKAKIKINDELDE